MLIYREFKTKFGPLTVVVEDETQEVIRSGFFKSQEILKKEFADTKLTQDKELFLVAKALEAWQDKDLAALGKVPANQPGSEFKQSCFTAMRKVPAGKTLSYTQLAAKSINPKAVRAAASACANNQLAPFVPCHRIIKSSGEIGNYAFGNSLKMAILQHEGAI
ncbi:MAG: hypothetical protein RL677_1040 [Actinomycetota bacterium]